MRKKIVIGNWKMNKTAAEATAFASEIRKELEGMDASKVVYGVAPGFLALHAMVDAGVPRLLVVAQDAHYMSAGAFTGNVSYSQLKAEGVTHALVGHSERRAMNGDTDTVVNKKVVALLNEGMVPVLCIGETLAEFEARETRSVLTRQLREAFAGATANHAVRAVIAYEPVWAIGTGRSASPAQAQEAIACVRAEIATLFDQKTADAIAILYGGSVKPDNIKELVAQPDIDGALVGNASLQPRDFAALIRGVL